MPYFDLYLVTPELGGDRSFKAEIIAALAVLKPAALLLRLPKADDRALINLVKELAAPAQTLGCAVLISGAGPSAAQIAVRGGADGVHAPSAAAIAGLRAELKGERMVGAGGLTSRHDAMDAGEAGADYVMFGEPDAGGASLSPSALVERAAWWAEIFETPCAAYAGQPDLIQPLAFTRAEFIALGPWCFADPALAGEAVERARAAIAAPAPAP
jgi:thiamine-phosphate pyrophosphorylase